MHKLTTHHSNHDLEHCWELIFIYQCAKYVLWSFCGHDILLLRHWRTHPMFPPNHFGHNWLCNCIPEKHRTEDIERMVLVTITTQLPTVIEQVYMTFLCQRKFWKKGIAWAGLRKTTWVSPIPILHWMTLLRQPAPFCTHFPTRARFSLEVLILLYPFPSTCFTDSKPSRAFLQSLTGMLREVWL